MKKLFIFLFFFNFSLLYGSEIKFEKIISGLDKPWSLSFINQENIIFTEKSGNLFTLNLKDKKNLKLNMIFYLFLKMGKEDYLMFCFMKEKYTCLIPNIEECVDTQVPL